MILSSDTKTLLSYWDANAYYPEHSPEFVAGLSLQQRSTVRAELECLMNDEEIASILESATANIVEDRSIARNFVWHLMEFLEGREDPPEID